jgi:hypothetical protein
MAGGQTAKPFFVGEIVRQPPEALDAFVAVAEAGNEFVYCEAPSPIRDETWLRAGALARLGLVRTHDRRRPGGGRQWYLVRTRKPLPKDVSPQQKVLNDAATAAIFVQLKREANFSLPCSTDAALARLTGLNTRNQAQHRVQELIRAELIESQIAYEGGVQTRVVTIRPGPHAGSAGGKSTALPKKWAKLMAAAEREGRSAGCAK